MNTTLSNIMKRAWSIYRMTNEAFASCLKRAWALYKLAKKMHSQIVEFVYEKVNGEIRHAKGTLSNEYVTYIASTNRKHNDDVMVYFDVEADGFRSFRCEKLMMVI